MPETATPAQPPHELVTAHPLAGGIPPAWASQWGHDKFGPFVEFEFKNAQQRLRWIPPGRFQMGSPATEEGREKREGPRHWVQLTDGFWLFDTPCTQALWEAVMGDNRSRFKSLDRPVEQVSWDDVQSFLAKINAETELELVLPSEAQWEYACRAGTETATYVGDLEIIGDANAPLLDDIAWYGGNSGVGFELSNGVSIPSRIFKNRQYADDPGGTHPVGEKKPNAWGIFDMLGNVWEWCGDVALVPYRNEPSDDPVDQSDALSRVLRGGAWDDWAKAVRAASRGQWHHDGKYDNLGFRCAQFSSRKASQGSMSSGEPVVKGVRDAAETGSTDDA